jgi:hypothetical protein
MSEKKITKTRKKKNSKRLHEPARVAVAAAGRRDVHGSRLRVIVARKHNAARYKLGERRAERLVDCLQKKKKKKKTHQF